MSLGHPGAVPDGVAWKQSVMNRAVEHGLLPDQFYFIGDNAYPPGQQMLVPFNRWSLTRGDPKQRDSFNFYLSQLRIHIECTFGILVNRFPILQHALKCQLLENAILTFRTCVALHNLLVDRRIKSFTGSPKGMRVVQIPNHERSKNLSPDDFHEVPEVDETSVDDLCDVVQTQTPTLDPETPNTNTLDRREEYVRKVYENGYVRPRISGWQRLSLQLSK